MYFIHFLFFYFLCVCVFFAFSFTITVYLLLFFAGHKLFEISSELATITNTLMPYRCNDATIIFMKSTEKCQRERNPYTCGNRFNIESLHTFVGIPFKMNEMCIERDTRAFNFINNHDYYYNLHILYAKKKSERCFHRDATKVRKKN